MVVRLIRAVAVAALVAGCAPRQDVLPPPRHADVSLAVENLIVESRVPARATLDGLLRDYLSKDLVNAAILAARDVFNPRELRANQPYKLVMSLDGLLREFEVQLDADRCLRIVSRDPAAPDALDAQVLAYEKQTAVVSLEGHIDSDHPSLIAAMEETGENVQLALGLADIFAGQIDFQHDLQPEDRFRLLFEKSTREGQFAGYGTILAATFESGGRPHQAFRWTNPHTGKSGYYDQDGRSIKRFFLASPLKFVVTPRVTSGFSLHRLHPIYREYRAHLGVDYGAPIGAPVVAVANGVVVAAGYSGGGGNMIRLRHASGYETYYLHLSAFGKGIHAGARVEQGQVIGRVGMTGSATGPHLDYRLRRNGTFVNPLLEHRRLPPGEPIPTVQLADFRTLRDRLTAQLTGPVLADAARKPDAVKAAAPH
jgi:murein DD-endopeptidase MepM/ murein hydrolase activator NlpD